MSSLRKALPRREHKERSQLGSRKGLGLLEKKKDYKLRAKDYHRKQDFLTKLQQKATLRNEDEFYFGMIHSKTEKGVHVKTRTEKFDKDSQKLLKTQDLSYIRTQYQMNAKKIERLTKDKQVFELLNTHTVFDEDSNPITVDTKNALQELPAVDEKLAKEIKQQRKRDEAELQVRKERDEKLLAIKTELETQKLLMGKGTKKKVGTNELGLDVFKWKSRRKR